MTNIVSLFQRLYDARWLLFSGAILLYAFYKYRTYRRLQVFEGPFLSGWCGAWHICALLSLRSHQWYANACDKYGE
jgi:hypothetical protein